MSKKLLIIGTAMLIAIGFTAVIMVASCQDREHAKKISLEGERAQVSSVAEETGKPIRVVVGVLVSPKDTYGYYKELFDYLAEKLGSPVASVHRNTQHEILELIRSGEFDIALTCSVSYIDFHDAQKVELVAVPQINNKIASQSYIIAPVDSSITSFEDLRNQNFCFTSRYCVTGYILPTYILAQQGETPEAFFRKYSFTGSHADTIEAVARNIVDGGAVNSLVWEYCNHRDPKHTSKTKIIKKSTSVTNPPIVVRSDMSAKLKNKIRDVLLGMHQEMKGKKMLNALMIDKFVSVDDSAYDSVRKIKEFVDLKK